MCFNKKKIAGDRNYVCQIGGKQYCSIRNLWTYQLFIYIIYVRVVFIVFRHFYTYGNIKSIKVNEDCLLTRPRLTSVYCTRQNTSKIPQLSIIYLNMIKHNDPIKILIILYEFYT